jgi:hypothetical protein
MTTYSPIAKAATSFAKGAKAAVDYVKAGLTSFLLKQDNGYLLLEHGGRIILNSTPGGKEATAYTKQPK